MFDINYELLIRIIKNHEEKNVFYQNIEKEMVKPRQNINFHGSPDVSILF